MTLLPQLRQTAIIVRRLTVNASQQVSMDEAGSSVFPCALSLPNETTASDDESPRSVPAGSVRWSEGFRGAPGPVLSSGSRMAIAGDTWELVGKARQIRRGSRLIGWDAKVQLVNVLYPFVAVVKDQSNVVVQAAMPCAVWGGTDSHQDTGSYEDREAEAPIEFSQDLQRNNSLFIGDQKLKIISATVDTIGPRVKMSVRRPGG